MWFLENPARLAQDRAVVTALDEWLSSVIWRFADDEMCVDADILVHGQIYAVRMSFPPGYPATPPAVRPQTNARWSEHQYGCGGDLCLELGPDNWHPDRHDAEEILRSTERLLRLEHARREGSEVEIPSRHELTRGQEARHRLFRFVLTDGALATLNGLDGALFDAKVIIAYHESAALLHLAEIQSQDTAWTNPEIPRSQMGQSGCEIAASVLARTNTDTEWDALLSAPAKALDDDKNPGDSGQGPNCLIAKVPKGTWHALWYWKTDSRASVFEPLTVASSNALARTGLPQNLDQAGRVAVVGLGSLGSRIALSIGRSGVKQLLLVDDDLLEPVNLVRHDADWSAVGLHKADYLAERLRRIHPDLDIRVRKHRIGGQESATSASTLVRELSACSLIVDATANDAAFNHLAYICRQSSTPMLWAEVFGGGIGGLVARARPGFDADPYTIRGAINGYCEEHPDPDRLAEARDYSVKDEDGGWLTATDAEVCVIAHHAAQMAMGCLLGGTGMVVHRKFAPMLARQVNGQCLRYSTSSQRRRCKMASSRTSEHNESNRRKQVPPIPRCAEALSYAARLNATIGRYFRPQ